MEFLIHCIGWFILYSIVDYNRGKDKLINPTSIFGWCVIALLIGAVYLINLKL